MQIIDFEKRGNLVRFWLGEDGLQDYYGDDWDDRPYEHNAGEVYDRFVSGYRDIVFPWNYIVAEPSEDWRYGGNSPWCKDDMRERKVPCIVAIAKEQYNSWDEEFQAILANKNAVRFYFGDPMEPSESITIFRPDSGDTNT